MPIFKNRPLCLLCLLFLFGIFLTIITDAAATIYLAALSVFFFVLFLALMHRPRRGRRRLLLCAICAAVIFLSQVFSYAAYIYPSQALPKGQEISVIARVQEVTYTSSYATECYAALESADGMAMSHRVEIAFDSAQSLKPGDRISFYATAKELQGEDALYRKGDGCIASLTEVRDLTLLSHDPTLSDRINETLSSWRAALSAHLITHIPGEGGALMSAMLLGERDALSRYTTRDFRRLGLSHILAISGLHLQILVFLLSNLLQRLGLRRRYALPIIILLILFYIALTGFSPSVVRAGVMAIMLAFSFLVRERSDSLTSLFFAASLICLFSPTTVYDVGFLLSCFATLGILITNELRDAKRQARLPRPLQWVLSSLSVTLSATLATLPIVALFFGEISILSPLANLLLTPLFSLYLACAIPALFLAPIPAVGRVLSVLGQWILAPIHHFSEAKYALIDIRFPDLLILAFAGGAILFLLLCLAKRKRTIFIAGGVILCLLVLSGTVHTLLLNNRAEVYYAGDEKNDFLLLCDAENTLLYDASFGNSGSVRLALSLFDEAHVTELDGYFLSHYHASAATSLRRILSNIRIRLIYLPTPTTEAEEGFYRSCLSVCEAGGAAVQLYSPYDEIPLSTVTLIPHESGERQDSTHKAVALTVEGSIRLTYLGAGMAESDSRIVAATAVATSDYLIFGTHGMVEHAQISYPEYKTGLGAIIVPRAEERLEPVLYALFTERGILVEESRFVLPLSP